MPGAQEKLTDYNERRRLNWKRLDDFFPATRPRRIEHRAPAGGFSNADRVMDGALSLPCHHALSNDDVGFLVDSLAEFLPR